MVTGYKVDPEVREDYIEEAIEHLLQCLDYIKMLGLEDHQYYEIAGPLMSLWDRIDVLRYEEEEE